MQPERLFLRRCEQVDLLAKSKDQIDLLDLAGVLRQLMLDAYCLVHVVNTNRLKLRFQCDPVQLPASGAHVSLGSLRSDGRASRGATLSLDSLIKTPVALIDGQALTIRDIIKCASNSLGGVHFDPAGATPSDPKNAVWAALAFDDVPAGYAIIAAIADVLLAGLQPLIEDVKQRPPPVPPAVKPRGEMLALVARLGRGPIGGKQAPVPLPSAPGVRASAFIDAHAQLHVWLKIADRSFTFRLKLTKGQRLSTGLMVSVRWDINGDVGVAVNDQPAMTQPFDQGVLEPT